MSHSEHRGPRARPAAARELRALIERKEVGVSALSAATGIPRSSLHKKLSGDSQLTVDDLVKLAIALDVPAAELITVTIEPTDGDDVGTQSP